MFAIIKYSANLITVSRVIAAFAILFTTTFSVVFNILYIFCGISDIADGLIARKTHSESKIGETLDSIADFIFITVCLIKILPILNIPLWLWIWIAIIAIIKIINLVFGYVYRNKTVFLHTKANKLTGFMLFLMPLLIVLIKFDYIVVAPCMVATFAAIQECHLIKTKE